MKHTCKICDYETDNKSNYNRHIKSASHIHIAETTKINSHLVGPPEKDNSEPKYECPHCETVFQHQSSLSRHINNRCKEKNNNKTSEIAELKQLIVNYQKEVVEYKKENDEFKKQLVKPTKTIINNNQTYNISVQNQIIQTYSKAPILQALDDYEVLDKYDEDEDSNIIEKLINNQKKNSLAKFLGDFIITIYKKDDPTEQSLWSSDTARLTYVIRELMAGKNKKKQRFQWNKDAKAIKTAEYIIVPMLEYITYHIDEYRKIHDEYLKSGVFEKAQKYRDIYEILGEIEVNSDNGILKKQIIRYITPYFQFNNGTKLIK